MKFLAQILSHILNPLVISVPGMYLLVYRSTQNSIVALKWTVFSLFFSGLVGLFVLYGIARGFFSDFDVSKREERLPLFQFVILISFLYFFSVLFLHGPRILYLALLDVILGIVLMTIINRRVKASGHIAVLSAFVLSIVILYGGYFFLGLILIPVLAWSRIVLKRHTLFETIVGFLIGSVLISATFVMVKYVLIYLI